MTMKILAFNSSPHKERGATASILGPFLDGAKAAGAEVDLVYVHDLKIKPCLGCFACWVKTPGTCVHKDEMTAVLEKILWSDALVLATPLYVDGMTGTMKMMVDRFIPLAQPSVETVDGRTRHPGRYGRRDAKVVLVSVSGFPELANFEPLVEHVKAICANMRGTLAGALLRPAAAALPSLKQHGIDVDGVYAAAREAGRQFVQDGAIAEATQAAVSREFIPPAVYQQRLNAHFKQQIDAAQTG
jgi:multimeric flavodoxin WrbA